MGRWDDCDGYERIYSSSSAKRVHHGQIHNEDPRTSHDCWPRSTSRLCFQALRKSWRFSLASSRTYLYFLWLDRTRTCSLCTLAYDEHSSMIVLGVLPVLRKNEPTRKPRTARRTSRYPERQKRRSVLLWTSVIPITVCHTSVSLLGNVPFTAVARWITCLAVLQGGRFLTFITSKLP